MNQKNTITSTSVRILFKEELFLFSLSDTRTSFIIVVEGSGKIEPLKRKGEKLLTENTSIRAGPDIGIFGSPIQLRRVDKVRRGVRGEPYTVSHFVSLSPLVHDGRKAILSHTRTPPC